MIKWSKIKSRIGELVEQYKDDDIVNETDKYYNDDELVNIKFRKASNSQFITIEVEFDEDYYIFIYPSGLSEEFDMLKLKLVSSNSNDKID